MESLLPGAELSQEWQKKMQAWAAENQLCGGCRWFDPSCRPSWSDRYLPSQLLRAAQAGNWLVWCGEWTPKKEAFTQGGGNDGAAETAQGSDPGAEHSEIE